MKLPQLLYVADVPVEASYQGSALVYRLLRNYPVSVLRVVETSILSSQPARRLPSVTYGELDVGSRRFLDTRLHALVNSWYTLRAASQAKHLPRIIGSFCPTAVLTVAHGYGWLAAARYAHERGLPLHLVIHDDWPRQAALPAIVRAWLDRRFGEVYRQASSRFCVSPYMEETYRRRYGVKGSVLLPSRAPDATVFESPPPRVLDRGRPLVFGFGGTINTPGYAESLRTLASALERICGQLHIYGPISKDQAAAAGLDRGNVVLCGLVPSDQFIARIREEVDVLFMPISFDAPDLENMRLCFPSKLTDYTAAGIPILAFGPADSSGVRWARENSAAEIVETRDAAAMIRALDALQSPERRWTLAANALASGARQFSHSAAEASFFSGVSGLVQ